VKRFALSEEAMTDRNSLTPQGRNGDAENLNMKKVLLPGVGLLFFAMATLWDSSLSGSQDRDSNEGTRERFIGTRRLASLEEEDADGNVHSADATGMLVFTREGRMSVRVMYRNQRAETSSGPVQYVQGGYEASFGRYEIDERAHRFTYHVEGALLRSLIGKDLIRLFELYGKQLIVKSSSPTEHWRVVWEHY
jgi:lipocalin-like protein